jgi:hypothetical protein
VGHVTRCNASAHNFYDGRLPLEAEKFELPNKERGHKASPAYGVRAHVVVSLATAKKMRRIIRSQSFRLRCLPPPFPTLPSPLEHFFDINHPLVQLLEVCLQLSVELLVIFNARNCFRASKIPYLSKALCSRMACFVETKHKWHRYVNAV